MRFFDDAPIRLPRYDCERIICYMICSGLEYTGGQPVFEAG